MPSAFGGGVIHGGGGLGHQNTNGHIFMGNSGGHGSPPFDAENESYGIRDVWTSNLYEVFKSIRSLIAKGYTYIAMDTEFPGVVARPIGEFKSTSDYQYQLVRCNVDLLKIIQLGLSFFDENGNTPPQADTPRTYQFNFTFSIDKDMYAQDSIELLTNSGIPFRKLEEDGICPYEFAELFIISGILFNEEVKWISFHSGYDFAYLIKILTDKMMPEEESDFHELLRSHFPCVYDIKYLMKSTKNLKGGLQEVADQLEIKREGPQHQAGSDSLLTGKAFFRMREMFFEDTIDDSKYSCHLYGLGTTSILVNGTALEPNEAASNTSNGGGVASLTSSTAAANLNENSNTSTSDASNAITAATTSSSGQATDGAATVTRSSGQVGV